MSLVTYSKWTTNGSFQDVKVPGSEQVTMQYETVGNGSWSFVHTDSSLSGVFNGSTALNITAPSGWL